MEGGGTVPEQAEGLDENQWGAGGIEDSRLTGIIVVVAEADPLGASMARGWAGCWGSLRAGDSAGQLSSMLCIRNKG